jgi:hypothetical protein
MDEILKKLLESDVLSEETKAELQEQFKSAVDTFLSEERAKLEQQITAQLTEEFVKAQEQLTEALDVKIDTFLAAEFDELKEDINKFRDLEVEYAEKLVEEKETLATQLSEELDQLVDKLDAFLEVRLDEEFAELKEDIAEVKKLEFGRRIFEAMESEFRKHRVSDTSKLESELAEAKEQLDDAKRRIGSMQRERVAEARNSKMEELLSPLSGTAKEQMKIILSNVATEKLDEAYKVYLTRVLKESTASVVKTEEAKKERLSESKEQIAEATLVTGNEVSDDADDVETQPDQLSRIRRLAGLA